jgi:hypothetical protein
MARACRAKRSRTAYQRNIPSPLVGEGLGGGTLFRTEQRGRDRRRKLHGVAHDAPTLAPVAPRPPSAGRLPRPRARAPGHPRRGLFCSPPRMRRSDWFLSRQVILDILPEILEAPVISSQKRAIQNYRTRLRQRGLARFEVLGLKADRELIRSVARGLAEDGPEGSRLRAALSRSLAGQPEKKHGILAALRRSPLVGADLDLTRSREEGREVEF